MAETSVILPAEPNARWELARQMGVEHAVAPLPDPEGDADPWEFEPMLYMTNRFRDAGFEVDVVENRPPMRDVVLGREGRDEQIETVKTLLRNMGRLDIGVYCWIWMEPLSVLRTSWSVPGRGGSVTCAYEQDQMDRGPDVDAVPEAELWENLEYFLDEVIPVAEEAGVKMALHPDDPPHGPIRGQDRIVTSVENYDRILGLNDSDHHGITLCQGNFAAMGADIPETIRHFGDRIHFAHFRDVEGTADSFVETWHDEGPTDMLAAMAAYEEIGFDGPIRPDHVPAMAGEGDDYRSGGEKGRLFAVGYMRGLLEAVQS
jgi:mannonate dehydratase